MQTKKYKPLSVSQNTSNKKLNYLIKCLKNHKYSRVRVSVSKFQVEDRFYWAVKIRKAHKIKIKL